MHHRLFTTQAQWSPRVQEDAERLFLQYANSINLDAARFKRDLHSREVIDKIRGDRQTGDYAGVTGTPTFFLNGQKITPKPRTYEEFEKLIRQTKTDLP